MKKKNVILKHKLYFVFVSLFMVSLNTFSQTNVALNKTVTSTSAFTSIDHLVNGNTADNGYTSATVPITIVIDLYAAFTISPNIKVYWMSGGPDYATNYYMQTSPDNTNWTTFGTPITSKSSSATDVFTGTASNVKFVRMVINAYTTYGPPLLISEIEVYSSTMPPNAAFNNLNTSGYIYSIGNITTLGNITSGSIVANGSLVTYGSGLNGSTYQQFLIAANTTNGNYLDLSKDGSGTKLPLYIKWRGDAISASALTIAGSNIAIGTSTAPGSLTLYGTINASNGSLIISGSSSTNILVVNGTLNSGIQLTSNNTSKGYFWYDSNLDAIFVGPGSTVNSISFKNGNVGIGTANPNSAYKLDVLGIIRARELKVDMNGVADYVFKPGYKLRSISEVDEYIKQHNHLPDIKPAEEIEKEGASVGDMQNKLLQKVEELTLYMIELKKENDLLKEEIEKIKNK